MPRRCELNQHGPRARRRRESFHQASSLRPVYSLRYRTGRDQAPGSEVAGRQPVRRTGPPQRAEQVQRGRVDPDGGQGPPPLVRHQLCRLPDPGQDPDRPDRHAGLLAGPRPRDLLRPVLRAHADSLAHDV